MQLTNVPTISVTDMEIKQELYSPTTTSSTPGGHLEDPSPLSYHHPMGQIPPPPQYPYDGGYAAAGTVVIPPPLVAMQQQPLATSLVGNQTQKPQSIENITKNFIKEGLKMKVKER